MAKKSVHSGFVSGIERSPYDIRNYQYERVLKAVVSLPEEYDLRDRMFAVRDQGVYGTCSAQTAAQMKENQEIMHSKLRDRLSPQFIYNLRSNYPAEGMVPKDTMKILVKYGTIEEKLYPYAKDFSNTIAQELIDRAASYRCLSFAEINTIDGLKQALVQNGVCYIGVPVYHMGEKMWRKEGTSGVSLGGHAMSIVGYNKEGFIIRNSWGKGWGDNGHTIFPYSDWGLHWECWTAVDSDGIIPPRPTSKWKEFWLKVWNKIVNLYRKYFC